MLERIYLRYCRCDASKSSYSYFHYDRAHLSALAQCFGRCILQDFQE